MWKWRVQTQWAFYWKAAKCTHYPPKEVIVIVVTGRTRAESFMVSKVLFVSRFSLHIACINMVDFHVTCSKTHIFYFIEPLFKQRIMLRPQSLSQTNTCANKSINNNYNIHIDTHINSLEDCTMFTVVHFIISGTDNVVWFVHHNPPTWSEHMMCFFPPFICIYVLAIDPSIPTTT
jgi:hypothetical protein